MNSTNCMWYFGMKVHIGIDTQGLMHRVPVTSANAHNVTLMVECFHGQEEVVYRDKACMSALRKVRVRGGQWRVLPNFPVLLTDKNFSRLHLGFAARCSALMKDHYYTKTS